MNHPSESASALQAPVPQELENRLYARIVRRLIPLLFFAYVLDYLDRVNVSFAKFEMLTDLKWTETMYGFGAGIFFIGYFLLQVPSNMIIQRFGARRWMGLLMITWGFISAATMFVTTPASFYTLRFFLGLAEAGLFPGAVLYLTYWFPSRRRAQVGALFMTAMCFSGAVGSPISGYIMQAFSGVHGLAGWKWLFLIEGLPSVLLGVVTLCCLDDSIRDAKWLTAAEKDLLAGNLDKPTAETHISPWKVMVHPRIWLLNSAYFCAIMGVYAISFWLPQIIKSSGVADLVHVGIFSMIPYGVAMAVMVWVSRHSDQTGERRWHFANSAFAGAAGLILCGVFANNTTLALIALTVATSGIMTTVPMIQTFPTEFLSGMAAATGIAVINSVGNLAGFLSPYMVGFIKEETHSTVLGLYAIAGCVILGGLLIHARINKDAVPR